MTGYSPGPISSLEERERERVFYLTPAAPGCGHMVAGAAEVQPL